MTNAHTPMIERNEAGHPRSIKCSEGDFLAIAGGAGEAYYLQIHKDHASQYEPGRAPDIAIDWVIDASCSICDDGGRIDVVDSECIRCEDCGATWDMNGDNGERDA